MTHVTAGRHLFLGPSALLAFRHFSGPASRRSVASPVARSPWQQAPDRRDFQVVVLPLRTQGPLAGELDTLMPPWRYFSARSLGGVGGLKAWLVRAVATACHEGSETRMRPRVPDHALSEAPWARMAIEATEGAQALCATAQRREPVWSLFHRGQRPT
jgi:hypothetical protein